MPVHLTWRWTGSLEMSRPLLNEDDLKKALVNPEGCEWLNVFIHCQSTGTATTRQRPVREGEVKRPHYNYEMHECEFEDYIPNKEKDLSVMVFGTGGKYDRSSIYFASNGVSFDTLHRIIITVRKIDEV